MADHYYTSQPQSGHEIEEFETDLLGNKFIFETDKGVFSRGGIDFGTRLLVETFYEQASVAAQARLLELGVGYGPIVTALGNAYPEAQVVGVEINERAYHLALKNLSLNEIKNVELFLGDAQSYQSEDSFSFVLTNPPIRAGKAVIQAFVLRASELLEPGGSIWLVIQKKQGAPSMRTFMEEHFAEVKRVALKKGYWILKGVKEK